MLINCLYRVKPESTKNGVPFARANYCEKQLCCRVYVCRLTIFDGNNKHNLI